MYPEANRHCFVLSEVLKQFDVKGVMIVSMSRPGNFSLSATLSTSAQEELKDMFIVGTR